MFDKITEDMLVELSEDERKKLRYIEEVTGLGKLVPPLALRWFTDVAFSLAQKSVRAGTSFRVAAVLGEIFDDWVDSSLISLDTKKGMVSLIADAKLDFVYASGNHDIASMRLRPYLM